MRTLSRPVSSFWKTATLIFHFLFTFTASLAPLLFLVGAIATLDQYGTQRRMVEHLQAYGKAVDATVSYIDDESGRAGVDYVRPDGAEGYGVLDLRYYSSEVQATIQPGAVVRILYIDANISESEKVVLAEYYGQVKGFPALRPDYLWLLFITWLIIMIKPQFVFLGMIDFEKLLQSTVPGVR